MNAANTRQYTLAPMQDTMINATEEANTIAEPRRHWVRNAVISSIALLGVAAMTILGTSGGANDEVDHKLGLSIAQKSPSAFTGSFGAGSHTIHAQTTGKSVLVQHQLAHERQPKLMFSTESKLMYGYEVTETKINEHSFVTVLSPDNNKVMLQGTTHNLRPHMFKKLYEEDEELHPSIRQANAAYQQAKKGTPTTFMAHCVVNLHLLMRACCADLFVTHKSQLESFVDMAIHMGSKHNISGVEFAHVKPLYILALETSKALKYFPNFEPKNSGKEESPTVLTTAHRQMQSCQDNTCGMSGSCSGSDCRGMCGPSCAMCWYWICNSCCWMSFCESHDDCCSQVGMTGGPCWVRPTHCPCVVLSF